MVKHSRLVKRLYLLIFLLLTNTAFGQSQFDRTRSLLEWLVAKHHVKYLFAKSNAAVFYDKNGLTKQTLVDENDKEIPGKCMKDNLSAAEIELYKTVPSMLMQTDWRKHFQNLKVKFISNVPQNSTKSICYFTEPIFLNDNKTRALIGWSFTCGIGCGRDDLLLCELRDGHWSLIAEAVIYND